VASLAPHQSLPLPSASPRVLHSDNTLQCPAAPTPLWGLRCWGQAGERLSPGSTYCKMPSTLLLHLAVPSRNYLRVVHLLRVLAGWRWGCGGSAEAGHPRQM